MVDKKHNMNNNNNIPTSSPDVSPIGTGCSCIRLARTGLDCPDAGGDAVGTLSPRNCRLLLLHSRTLVDPDGVVRPSMTYTWNRVQNGAGELK